MKKKNITKYYKSKINSGWREYLDLNIPYNLLGLNKEDYLTKKDIETLTGLKFDKEESGFVDHYNMLDYKYMHNGQPLNVSLKLKWGYLREETVEKHLESTPFLPNNLVALVDGSKVYYCEGRAGYKNPKWTVDSLNEVKYWLYKDNDELKPYDWFWTYSDDLEDKSGDERIVKLLTKFINTKKLGSDLFSGDFCYQLISGNCGQSIKNNLIKDLSELATYCKTIYEEPNEQHLTITYAIRYKSNIELFLKELKKICIAHKLPKLI